MKTAGQIIAYLEAELADRGYDRGRTGAEDLLKRAVVCGGYQLVNRDPALLNGKPPMLAHLDDRVARNAGQDAAVDGRGDDLAMLVFGNELDSGAFAYLNEVGICSSLQRGEDTLARSIYFKLPE